MSTAPEPAEKRLHKADTLFRYGNEAAQKGNYKYAIDMYTNAAKIAPEVLVYRQALRGVARREFGNDPAKVGRMAVAKVQPIRLRARAAKAKGQWLHVLEVCEEAFLVDPWNRDSAIDASEAAEHLGLKALALWLLESVQPAAAHDAAFLRHLARVHEVNENWQKAIACWDRVKQLAPNDDEARRQVSALSAKATIQRSGLGEAIERASHAPAGGGSGPEPELPPGAEELRRASLTPEERLDRAIAEEPDRVEHYLELAEIHRRHERLDEAKVVLARGLKAQPNDGLLLDAYAEIQLARLNKAIAAWQQRVRDTPGDNEARQKLAQLNAKRDDYELAEFRRRAASRPEDLNLRYELGLRLSKAGLHDAAIAEFQLARSSPSLRVKALFQAGLSFEGSGVPKLAERSYQEALKAADPTDQPMVNSLHYRLGRVAESLGNVAAAEEHYNEVAANDFGYLDVAQRLRSLNQRPVS